MEEFKTNKKTFRLPDGKRTTSPSRYTREWRSLVNPVARFMDCVVHSMNPGVKFVNNDGVVFSVPLSTVKKIKDSLKKPRKKR